MFTESLVSTITETIAIVGEFATDDELFLLRRYLRVDTYLFLEHLDIIINDWLDENNNRDCLPDKLVENIDLLNIIMNNELIINKS